MQFTFDVNKNYEIPIITLCNPDMTQISDISNISNLHIKPRFNAVSEVSFEVNSVYFDTMTSTFKTSTYYELISKNRVLHIQGFGYFIIVQTEEINEGTKPYKEITAYSLEYMLNAKGVNILDGTYKFYDPINPTGTLLQKLIEIVPSWKIGTVSSSLYKKYRTFEKPSNSLYSFLMEDVEKAYECIFSFDTENRTINAYTPTDIVKDTNISLSFDNLIKNVKIEETSQDIITCLSVYGAGDFDIHEANPLGTDYIYDFSYYLNSNWMSESLIKAVTTWQKKIKNSEKEYLLHFSKLRDSNNSLLKLQSELKTLQNNLKSQELIRSSQMPNISNNTVIQINKLQNQISKKEDEISSTNYDIKLYQNNLKKIHDNLSITNKNNFSTSQIKELDNFIFQANYTNSNFVVTDSMTTVEISDMATQLMEQGKQELTRLSQPSFTFSMDVVNFLFIEKFKPFINELKLGSLVHAEIKKDNWVSPILLEMDIDYDNPNNFTMTFGNKYRLQTNEWTFKELFDQSKVTNSVSRNYSGLLAPIKNGGLDDRVSEYMNNALDSANQEILNSKSQDISIGDYGIKGRKKLSNGTFDKHQLMITNNLICMTDDNWQTSKLAIGQIKNGNGKGTSYGIVADTIVGKLLAGNSLTISNENNTFTVDGSGAKLVDATFEVTDKAGHNKIILSKSDGIKIQKKENGRWENQFYADSNGNLILKGQITADSGTVGGFKITKTTIESNGGNIKLESNGNAKIGLLTVKNNGTATFDGTISANKIVAGNVDGKYHGYITNTMFANKTIEGNKLQDSTITGNQISSRTIYGGNIVKNEIGIDEIIRNKIVKGRQLGLDNIYATNAKFKNLSTTVANIDKAYIKQADIENFITKDGTFSGTCKWTWKQGSVLSGTTTIQQLYQTLYISNPEGRIKIEGATGLNTALSVQGNVTIEGHFSVADGFAKNCIQGTKNYGKRLINAYETAEYYYGDIGENEVKNGICKIEIDPIFSECVNLEVAYQVFLSPYGKGNVYVSKRMPTYFIVEGDNIPFCWELKAKRMGFENTRLKEFKEGE